MAIYYENSWIKLPRDFVKWRWYKNVDVFHIYLYLLLNANLEDESVEGTKIRRGEIYASLSFISMSTGLSIQKVRTCLAKLSSTNEIEFKDLGKGRVIIIVDFNRFQPIGADDEPSSWIRLYRKICDWGWYKNQNMTHLFVHFMINASIVTLPSGTPVAQYKCTLRRLNLETGISVHCIRDCIDKMRKSGEISYDTVTAHTYSIVTICNYVDYQDCKILSDTIVTQYRHDGDTIREIGTAHTEDGINSLASTDCKVKKSTSNTILTRYQHDTNTIREIGTAHTEDGINSLASTDCKVKKSTSNTILTRYQHDTNTILTRYQHDTNTNNKEYKNIRKEKEKKKGFIVDDARARAPESDFSDFEIVEEDGKENEQKKVKKESLLEIVKSDQRWMNAIQQRFNFACLDEVEKKFEDFELDLICRGKEEHKDEKDLKGHFCDWLSKNKASSPMASPSSQYQSTGLIRKERWPGEKFVTKSFEGYEGKF